MAVVAGQRGCVQQLLEVGADVDAPEGKGRSPLYLAAAAGDTSMCSLLVLHGANARRKAPDGFEPAIAAINRGHVLTAQRIIQDARLNASAVVNAAGVSLSQYFADLEQHTTGAGGVGGTSYRDAGGVDGGGGGAGGGSGSGSGTSDINGSGGIAYGKQRVAALLPASIARLRVDGRPVASPPAVRGINDTVGRSEGDSGECERQRQQPWQQQRRLPPKSGPPKAAKGANTDSSSSPAHPARRGSASGLIRLQPKNQGEDGTSQPARDRVLRRTWSGVHGGEGESAAAGRSTPGRRTPVAVDRRKGRDRKTERRESASDVESKFVVQQHQHDEQQQGQQRQASLLDRMTAFLFDHVAVSNGNGGAGEKGKGYNNDKHKEKGDKSKRKQ